MNPDDSQFERRDGATGSLLPSILLCLLFIVGVMALGACSVSGATLVDVQAEIDKAVAATVQAGPAFAAATQVSADVATQVAVQVAVMMATQQNAAVPEQQATATPLPPTPTTAPAEPTPVPSEPPPTPAPEQASATTPTISAEVDTNCRIGPGTGYAVDGYLLKGQSSTVHGRSADNYWWYIANPSKAGKYCWVWTGSTVVQGDTSSLDVVAAPSSGNAYSNTWLWSGYYPPYSYGGSSYACTTKKVLVCQKKNKCVYEKVKVCAGYPGYAGYYPGWGNPYLYPCPTCVYNPGYVYPPPYCKPVKPKAGCVWLPGCKTGKINNCKINNICWK